MGHASSPRFLQRPIWRAAIAAVLLGLIAAAVIAVQVLGDDGEASDDGSVADYEGPLYIACQVEDASGPTIGEPAPTFDLCDESGERVSSLNGRGAEVTFVNFWATWCTPCRRELPDIQALYNERRADGLEVLAVNVEEDREAAIAFMESRDLSLPIVLDPEGRVYDAYRLQGLPDSFFVGDDGTLETLQYGYLTDEKMRERVEQAGLE
jgi:peroxiredoxin